MRYLMRIEKRRRHGSFYGEIHVLWNVAGRRSDPQCVELGNYDANYVSPSVEKGADLIVLIDASEVLLAEGDIRVRCCAPYVAADGLRAR